MAADARNIAGSIGREIVQQTAVLAAGQTGARRIENISVNSAAGSDRSSDISKQVAGKIVSEVRTNLETKR